MSAEIQILEAIEAALRIMVAVQMGEQQKQPELKEAIEACRQARTLLHCKDCNVVVPLNVYGRCPKCQKEHDAYLADKMRAEHGPSRPDNSFRAHEHSTYNPVKGKA